MIGLLAPYFLGLYTTVVSWRTRRFSPVHFVPKETDTLQQSGSFLDEGADLLAEPRRLQRMLLDAGREIVDLSMINPDLAPPRYMLDKLLEATGKSSNHRYAVSRGIRRLRAAFSFKYESAFSTVVDPEREVCVCLGSKDGLFQTLKVVLGKGEKALLPAPAYPAHVSAVRLCGGTPVFFPVATSEQYLLRNVERLIESERPRCLVVNFPHNPTGVVLSEGCIRELVEMCGRHGVIVINDFVYGEMGFEVAEQVPSFVPREGTRTGVVEVYSLSKAYSVPGWRVGAVVGDESIVKAVARLKSHVDYGLFLPIQIAAAAALTAPTDLVGATTREYQRRARTLVAALERAGWDVAGPRAGCSVWARIPDQLSSVVAPSSGGAGSSSLAVQFTSYFLQHDGVLVAPGPLFGEGNDSWIRFALVVSEERIREVGRKIGAMRALTGGARSDVVVAMPAAVVNGNGDTHQERVHE
jgi:alanine-synthesizing transaminase